MNLKTGQFHKPAIQVPNAMDKNQLKSYHFLYDKLGNAYLFDKHSALFKKFHLLDNPIYINARDKNFVAAESQDKKVYITSYGSGFFVYDPKTDILQQFSVQNDNSLFHTDFLLNVFVDRSDCVWVGTGDGVFCCVEQKELNSEFIKMEPRANMNGAIPSATSARWHHTNSPSAPARTRRISSIPEPGSAPWCCKPMPAYIATA